MEYNIFAVFSVSCFFLSSRVRSFMLTDLEMGRVLKILLNAAAVCILSF